jgi:hypothetical protein
VLSNLGRSNLNPKLSDSDCYLNTPQLKPFKLNVALFFIFFQFLIFKIFLAGMRCQAASFPCHDGLRFDPGGLTQSRRSYWKSLEKRFRVEELIGLDMGIGRQSPVEAAAHGPRGIALITSFLCLSVSKLFQLSCYQFQFNNRCLLGLS